jgi:hypothetical protein
MQGSGVNKYSNYLVNEEEVIGQTDAHHREAQFFAGD